ncbi:MAG: hypothetical protein U1E76_00095 [Planctomycetota bacterium]
MTTITLPSVPAMASHRTSLSSRPPAWMDSAARARSCSQPRSSDHDGNAVRMSGAARSIARRCRSRTINGSMCRAADALVARR